MPSPEEELARIDGSIEAERQHLRRLDLRLISFEAAADQDDAACAEAERCGCPIYVTVKDGQDVTGSARVVHECARD